MKGTFVDLSDAQLQGYAVTIGVDGKIESRDTSRRGGGLMRITPPPDPNAKPFNFHFPTPPADLPLTAPDTKLKQGEWNTAEMFMDANVVRTFLNDGREVGWVDDGSYGSIALYVG